MNLFVHQNFQSHAGLTLDWKIECDALADADWQTLAFVVANKMRISFGHVVGIPRGGLKFAEALQAYKGDSETTLLVDDVLTTGKSMAEWRATLLEPVLGVVVFARKRAPEWVLPMFELKCEE